MKTHAQLPAVRSGRESAWPLAATGAAALVTLGVCLLAGKAAGGTFSDVTVDAIASDLQSFARGRLAGIVSEIGVALWVVAASVSLFASLLLPHGHSRRMLQLLAALSLALGLDDQFLIHEFLSEHLPAGDAIVGVIYLGVGAGFVWAGHRLFFEDYGPILIAAGASLGISLLLDAFVGGTVNETETVLEDTFKFLGITWWATFVVLRSRADVLRHSGLTSLSDGVIAPVVPALEVIDAKPATEGGTRRRRRPRDLPHPTGT